MHQAVVPRSRQDHCRNASVLSDEHGRSGCDRAADYPRCVPAEVGDGDDDGCGLQGASLEPEVWAMTGASRYPEAMLAGLACGDEGGN